MTDFSDFEAESSVVEVAAGIHDVLALHDLHPVIREAAIHRWSQADYSGAVRASWFALRDLLRQRLGRPDLDGENLVNAIGETADEPALPLTDYGSTTERNIHRGLVQILRGVVFYIRHPDAHESVSLVAADREDAFECLTVMSMCTRYVANAAAPTAVEEAVDELLQPRFPTTSVALDDLIRPIPRRRVPEFLALIHESALEAFNAEEIETVGKLANAEIRALSIYNWDHELVAQVAARQSALIARDETLAAGILFIPGPVFAELAPRFQEKVTAALTELARGVALDGSGVPSFDILPVFDLLTRIAELGRLRVFAALMVAIRNKDRSVQTFAYFAFLRGRTVWTANQVSEFAGVVAHTATSAPLPDGGSASLAGLVERTVGKGGPAYSAEFREAFAGGVRAQRGVDTSPKTGLGRLIALFDEELDPVPGESDTNP